MGVKCSTEYVLWAKKDETNSTNENQYEELFFQLCCQIFGKFCKKQCCCSYFLLVYEAAKGLFKDDLISKILF